MSAGVRRHLADRISIARVVAMLVVFVVCFAMGSVATAQKLPPHQKVVLKNGLTVLLLEKRGVPMIDIAGIVKAGALADPVGQEGLASATAGLLRKGTKTRTAQQFAADIDFIGGNFDADAGADYSSISAEFLKKDTAKGLELVADALLHPTFPQAEVDKLLAQSIDGVKAAKDSAGQVIFEYYTGYLYDGKEYGRPAGGDEASLAKIKRDAIVKFYDSYYTPENLILAVAGDFDAADIKTKLEQTFGSWTGRTAPAIKANAMAAVKGKKLLLIDKSDLPQTFFAIGNVGIAETDPDRVAIRVVNTVFGSRFTSMLNEALRVESGLTYGATSFFDPHKEPGPFVIFSYTKNETTMQTIDMALDVLKKLHADGVTAEQLASAKSFIKGQFPPTIETSAQLARVIASHEFYGLDDSEVNELEARVDGVTPEIAKRVIAKHFPQDDLVFVLIGKAAEIGPAVKKYAAKEDTRSITTPGYWPGSK
jgi:zinc protease